MNRQLLSVGDRAGTRVVLAVLDRVGPAKLKVRCDCSHVYVTTRKNLRRTSHCTHCNAGRRGRTWKLATREP